jgi:hypothetical protein
MVVKMDVLPVLYMIQTDVMAEYAVALQDG